MKTTRAFLVLSLAAVLAFAPLAPAADHNDPNAINSIFGDVPISAADLYDMFGWPTDDSKNVILALTFAPVPATGVFDTDLLYRIHINPDRRVERPANEGTLTSLLSYAEAVKEKYTQKKPFEVRVTFKDAGKTAIVDFIGFPSGNFQKTVHVDEIYNIPVAGGQHIRLFVGGRDDAFFNDLPGFFHSINYAPEFYKVPLADTKHRELEIPKTLLVLDNNPIMENVPPSQQPPYDKNKKYNYNAGTNYVPSSLKPNLPPNGPFTWAGNRYFKDANGNYRFVYSGKDAMAGRNINAIVLEIPLTFLTKNPSRDRVVNAWGESWILKASNKAPAIPNDSGSKHHWFGGSDKYATQLKKYKRVDTDGVPFADAGLNQREDDAQVGAYNVTFARKFAIRFGHLGWGFAPSVTALGLPTCFDHGDATVSKVVHYKLATAAFPHVKKCFFQELNMPDNSWNPKNLPIKQKRTFEIFIPNVNAIDMDTNGSWPFGRRLTDQVATRFLSTFLDHSKNCGPSKCNVESLGNQALWNSAKIEPKTPPNPLANDKPFLNVFPYLAEPWP
jgi:hypothetical protein